MGANGDYCVKEVLRGLKYGFHVVAYSGGIADFTRDVFRSPFFFLSGDFKSINSFNYSLGRHFKRTIPFFTKG